MCLVSTTAFNAFIGSGLVLGQITYGIPTALPLFRKCSAESLPALRYFKLSEFVG
jgi:choline transport protein